MCLDFARLLSYLGRVVALVSQISHKFRRSCRTDSVGDPGAIAARFLHHYHTSFKGGHQGIGRTYQQIRAKF